jgi:hypothetical protein
MRWVLGVLLAVTVGVSTAAGEYRTVEVEGLKITIDSDWGSRTAPGYYPVRFDITNTGEARIIEIIGNGMRYPRIMRSAPSSTVVRQPVRLARGDRVRLTIPIPVFADNENLSFEIREDGRVLERFNYFGLQSRMVPANASVLIVADPKSEFGIASAAGGWPRKAVATSTARTAPSMDLTIDPSRLPASWLGYTSLRAVLIGPTEWEQLNGDQRSALLSWTACGGDLIFVGGSLTALFPGGPPLRADEPQPEVRAYFFGRIHLPILESASMSGLTGMLAIADKRKDSNWALPANSAKDWGVIMARGFRLPIPGVDRVPARTYLFILLAFSLIVGPVNYWLLKRKGQQVMVVLTAPLISIVFILLLAGYVVAGEGIGVRARAMTFTMLDQARHQAATRASLSLYAAGMTPRDGLRFPRDTAVFPIGRDGNGPRESFTLDFGDGQRFPSGLLQARAPANFETIGVRAARERLTFTRSGDTVTVANGLGTTVKTLLYHDGQHTYALARPLAPGATESLARGTLAASSVIPSGLPLSGRLAYLVDNQPLGSYLAVLERSPFWTAGVSGVEERDSFHFVLGWPQGQP